MSCEECQFGFALFLYQNMSDSSGWEVEIEGDHPIHKAVVEGEVHFVGYGPADTDDYFAVMPVGTKVVSAESCGISAWTRTAKVSVVLSDGSPKNYFLKVDQPSSR